MKTSQKGIDLIKRFEGCRLSAYKCPAGVWTIGYGHTEGVTGGQKISQAQADAMLRADLEKYEKKVAKYDGVYHWTQPEFDAMVSFAFNLGSIDKLTASGTRSKKTIAEKMLLYNKAAGKELEGLTKRRKAEQELFLSETEGEGTIAATRGKEEDERGEHVHIVKRGDTLTKIAKRYDTTVGAIVANNRAKYPKMTANYIVVGWKLKV